VAIQPQMGPMPLRFDVYRSHNSRHTHTQPVALLWTSDQRVNVAATYTTHIKHKRRIPVLPAGFETAIPTCEQPQTSTLDRNFICYWFIIQYPIIIFSFFLQADLVYHPKIISCYFSLFLNRNLHSVFLQNQGHKALPSPLLARLTTRISCDGNVLLFQDHTQTPRVPETFRFVSDS
jgi:hypothetical protein